MSQYTTNSSNTSTSASTGNNTVFMPYTIYATGTYSTWIGTGTTWNGTSWGYDYIIGKCTICNEDVNSGDNHTDIKTGVNKVIYLCKKCTEKQLGTIIVADEL